MLVRSLSSSALTWPNRETVDRAVRRWGKAVAHRKPEVIRIGYLGSCARGDWVWEATSILWWFKGEILRRRDSPHRVKGFALCPLPIYPCVRAGRPYDV